MLDISKTIAQLEPETAKQLKLFFSNAPDWAVAACNLVTIKKNVEFVREETPAHTIYILIEGLVNANDYRVSDTAYSFKQYQPLIMLGDMEVITDSKTYITSLVTVTDCKFIAIAFEVYQKWMRRDLTAFWMQTELMTKSVLFAARKDRSFLFLEGIERLYMMLINLYETRAEAGKLSVRMTRKELADELGCSVRTVNRVLKKIQEQQLAVVQISNLTVEKEQYIKMKRIVNQKISAE